MARKTTSAKKSTSRKPSSTLSESPSAKQQKPVFRLGTLITLILLAGLIGFAYYLNNEKKTADAEATPTGEIAVYALDVEEASISSIEIKPAEGDAVKIARNAENVWAVEIPAKAEADQGLAQAAASQISALRVVSEIEGDPAIFGFEKPAYVIAIELSDGKKYTLEVGDSTPTNSGYYVRVDKKKMVIVSLSGIDSLTNLVTSPPYLNPPTPTLLPPTETPVPPPTETPEATVTPTP